MSIENTHTSTEIVRFLKRASDSALLDDHTPENMGVMLRAHSTAVHCHIYLKMKGEPDLLVWYKTNWVSSSYEFNEDGKVIGIQKDCEFVELQLMQFFTDVTKAIAEFDQQGADASRAKEITAEKSKARLVALYRDRYQ